MRPISDHNRICEAFTLIEIMLAVAIFAVVLAAINGVFYGAMRLRTKTTAAIEASLPVEQVLGMIKRDLQGLAAPGGTLSGSLKSGVAGSSTMDQQGGGTDIYTVTGIVDGTSPWANIQKVCYTLKQSTSRNSAGQDLVRLVTRNLLPTGQEEIEEEWLMSDVARIQFSFYDGSQWRTSWDSTSEAAVLPRAIKVQIDLAAKNEDSRSQTPIQLVVPVMVQANTNQTQTATGGS